MQLNKQNAEAERKTCGFLNSILKSEFPLEALHIGDLGVITVTSNKYKCLFVVVVVFTMFMWIFQTKVTNTN